ncbi:MAG: SpoIIE family protein phosphatase, partial [Spirochaetota bacterium]
QGKFDQFQRNIPFSALLIAFRELMHFLLAETEDSLNHWREELDFALGKNAQVLIDVIPELELIIGKKSPVPALSPAENQNRFNLTFQNFISVFNRKEHPIVLFIDDLQWADTPSLNLIKLIMTNSDNKYFMIIGAYRDNEVETGHPLLKTVEEINRSGLEVENIRLGPLNMDNIQELISDTFNSKQGSEQLAEILIQKTGGNPFFIGEFLKSLYKAEIIDFNYTSNEWQWNVDKIHAYGITDNVVDLMVKNIRNFPEDTAKILSLAACLGNQFDIKFLGIISQISNEDLIEFLWPAIDEGVLIPIGNAQSIIQTAREDVKTVDISELEKSKIRFQHDRVQQAAYSLVSQKKRKKIHYRAGNSILAKVSKEEIEEKIFEITRHLNEGKDLISKEEERLRLVELNLRAGQKAKLATAYESAVNILETAKELLTEEDWNSNYRLTFSLYINLIESLYLSGDLEKSKGILEYCYAKADNDLDIGNLHLLEIMQMATIGKYFEATDIGITALKRFSILLPEKSNATTIQEFFQQELDWFQKEWKDKSLEELLDLPQNSGEIHMLVMSILIELVVIAVIALPEYLGVITICCVNQSIQKGNNYHSSTGYVFHGITLYNHFRDYQVGHQFAKIGVRINEEIFNNVSVKASVSNMFGAFINFAVEPFKNSIPVMAAGFEAAMESGNKLYASYNAANHFKYNYFAGFHLKTCKDLCIKAVNTNEKLGVIPVYIHVVLYYGFLKNLLGEIEDIYSLECDLIDSEERFVRDYAHFGLVFTNYFALKIYLNMLYEDYAYVLKNTIESPSEYLVMNELLPHGEEYKFFAVLAFFQLYHEIERKNYETQIEEFTEYVYRLSKSAPTNFAAHYALIQAEKARVENRDSIAIQSYFEAIESAKENELIYNEALANKLCAQFWISRKNVKYGTIHMTEAYLLYKKWGALAKCDFLEKNYKNYIAFEKPNSYDMASKDHTIESSFIGDSTTFTTTLDLASMIRASQVLSEEIQYEILLEKLIKILVENAGAERVVLLSRSEDSFYIDADGTAEGKTIYQLGTVPFSETENVPISIINYVIRSKSPLILTDAKESKQFDTDSYLQTTDVKSVLCAPLSSKGELTGVIYLENNITTGAFTEDKASLLQTLASQAAISIENAKLYANIENVTREKTRVSTEMEIAETIQTSLLVEKTEFSGYEFLPYMRTSDEVGGDYYDLIQRDEGEWLVIGDVSGHGVTAGLIMMMVQTAIHSSLQAIDLFVNPGRVLQSVNEVISQNIKKMRLDKYMTLTLVFKDRDNFYYSGLHQDIAIYRHNEQNVERLQTNGSWIGMQDLFHDFPVGNFSLKAGDIVLLYTDGITEAQDETGNMLGDSGIADTLLTAGEKPLVEVKDSILEKIAAYKTDDDITFTLLKKNS